MRYSILLFTLSLFIGQSFSQTLYSRALGRPSNHPVIFIHGGPGSSSASFEYTTAQQLADEGYYVIFYDRRGEGRSTAPNAQYSFQQTFDDLNSLYESYGIKKASIIGYSFGGVLATLYAKKYPKKVSSLILVSALLDIQQSYRVILDRATHRFQLQNDQLSIDSIQQLASLDSSSTAYRSKVFHFATKLDFFNTPNRDEQARQLYAVWNTNPLQIKQKADTSTTASVGFWRSEHFTTLNVTKDLISLQQNSIPVFAMYGKDDGLYSPQQIDKLTQILPAGHIRYIENCSHTVFMDRQDLFLQTMKNWLD